MHEAFRHRDYWHEAALPAFIARQQALIDGARAAGIPVVQIFHVADSGAFSEASGFVAALAPLQITPDATKQRGRMIKPQGKMRIPPATVSSRELKNTRSKKRNGLYFTRPISTTSLTR